MGYDLGRFTTAQDIVYANVLAELQNGRKTGHWMWYIFPQIRGLGESDTSRFYAIVSRKEAQAYLAHPILGPRLRECTELVLRISGKSLKEIFGSIDAMKFCSSMTLFSLATKKIALFETALERYCEGRQDQATLDRLSMNDQE